MITKSGGSQNSLKTLCLEIKLAVAWDFYGNNFAPPFLKKICLGFFEPSLTEQLKIWTRNGEREKGNDMQQMARGGIEQRAAAARTQPLYMGHPSLLHPYPICAYVSLTFFRLLYLVCSCCYSWKSNFLSWGVAIVSGFNQLKGGNRTFAFVGSQ